MAQKLMLQKKFEQLFELKKKIQELEDQKIKLQKQQKETRHKLYVTSQSISMLQKQLLDQIN